MFPIVPPHDKPLVKVTEPSPTLNDLLLVSVQPQQGISDVLFAPHLRQSANHVKCGEASFFRGDNESSDCSAYNVETYLVVGHLAYGVIPKRHLQLPLWPL